MQAREWWLVALVSLVCFLPWLVVALVNFVEKV